jgi:hypothetical protein
MAWLSVDLLCDACGHAWDDLVDRLDPLTKGDYECPSCGGSRAHRTVSAPMILNASFPEGTRRFGKLRQEAVLDMARTEARSPQDRARVGAEIQKVKGTKT